MMWKTALLLLIGLNLGIARAQEPAPADAYFPLTAGTTWKYHVTVKAGDAPAKTSEQVVTAEARELAGTPVTLAGDTAYTAKDDGVYVAGVMQDGKLTAVDEPQKVVPADPRLGDKWTYHTAGGVASATCLGTERVKVGAGEYEAVKVYVSTVGGPNDSERRDVYRWFAKGVGPVKGAITQHHLGQDGSVSTRQMTMELASVELAKPAGAKPQMAGAASAADLFAQGEALARKGQHRDALAKYDAALSDDPKLAKAHAYKALSLMAQRDPDAAQREVGQALSLDPNDYTFQEIAGQVKVAQGRIPEAKALYDKAAATSPEHAGAVYTDLAAVLAARKDDRLAADIDQALKRAAAATPPSPEALFALGQSYVNAGRAEGKQYLQRYLDVTSKLPPEKRDPTKIRLARQLIRAIDAVKGVP